MGAWLTLCCVMHVTFPSPGLSHTVFVETFNTPSFCAYYAELAHPQGERVLPSTPSGHVPTVGRRTPSPSPMPTPSPSSWGAICQMKGHPAPFPLWAEQSLGALQRTWPSPLGLEAMTTSTSRLIPAKPPVTPCLAGQRISKVRQE